MAKKSQGWDVKKNNTGLTAQQYFFMKSLEEVVLRWHFPVSVDQIREQLKKSNSGVRSHLKILLKIGYICCVGKARVKRYIPSELWLTNGDSSVERLRGIPCLGGYCMVAGCRNKAEDFWKDGYYCRDHIIGHSAISDKLDLWDRFLAGSVAPSSASQLLNQIWPTYGEDMLD